MSQWELTHEEVEGKTPVDNKILEEAEEAVVAPEQPRHGTPTEKWAARTLDEQAEHHKKRQAAHAANKASTGPQTSPEKETSVTVQEQQPML
jgi:hypothetical protein